MKKRFTEEQIAFALRQAESGTAVAEITRKCGDSANSNPLGKLAEVVTRRTWHLHFSLYSRNRALCQRFRPIAADPVCRVKQRLPKERCHANPLRMPRGAQVQRRLAVRTSRHGAQLICFRSSSVKSLLTAWPFARWVRIRATCWAVPLNAAITLSGEYFATPDARIPIPPASANAS